MQVLDFPLPLLIILKHASSRSENMADGLTRFSGAPKHPSTPLATTCGVQSWHLFIFREDKTRHCHSITNVAIRGTRTLQHGWEKTEPLPWFKSWLVFRRFYEPGAASCAKNCLTLTFIITKRQPVARNWRLVFVSAIFFSAAVL